MTSVGDVELVAYSLALSWVGGLAGALALSAAETRRVYRDQVAKPTWAPPAWLFGVVWSVLYTLAALSYWLVRRDRPFSNGEVLPYAVLFYVSIAVLAAWSWVFFRFRLYLLGLVVVGVAFGVCLAGNIIAWIGHSWAAAALGIPQLLWLMVAFVLNAYAAFGATPPPPRAAAARHA